MTEGPVAISIIIYVAMSKSWSKKKREAAEGAVYASRKPDGDNVEKNVWDALTGISHKDDVQVVRWNGMRLWDTEDATLITVRHL
jgi:Holliday junction resolvase RusA-like endonuclease